MRRTVEAVIDAQGHVQVLEPISLPGAQRALVTVLKENLAPAYTTQPS
jgi:hypothetical protein